MRLRMLLAVLVVCCNISVAAQKTQFTQLPSEFAPELYFVAPGAGTYEVQLKFRTETYPSYIKLLSILNRDTLADYLSYTDSTSRLVKSFPLSANDKLTVQVYSNNKNQEDLVAIFGVIQGRFTPKIASNTSSNSYFELTGAIWNYDSPILLEINKEKEGKEFLDIKLGLNNSYPYDSIFVQIEAIGPGNAPIHFAESFKVQSNKRNPKGTIIHLNPKKIKTIAPGLYKVKITHQLADEHLNGVDFVSWSWVDK
jgi:hypothetical protein